MYLRRCYRSKSGKRHAYWALVESYRTARGPRQRVVAWLGTMGEASCRGVRAAASGQTVQNTLDGIEPAYVRIDPRGVRVEQVRDFGGPWLGLQIARQLELDWHASDCHVQETDGQWTMRLYMGCDGVMVPLVTRVEKRKRRAKAQQRRRRLRKPGVHRRPLPAMRRGAKDRFKEMKLVTFYDQSREHRLVRATRKNHQHAGQLMRQGLVSLRARGAQERLALIDGAVWIARQAQQRRPTFTAMTLDYWHLSEHVHATRREVFGDQASGGVWAKELLQTLTQQGYEPFWQALLTLRSEHRGKRARASIDSLMHYVASRRNMLDYVRHQQQGWDIGSGPTESMCKTLTRRVKGGKRWDADHAEAMMALEAILQSKQWSCWWHHRLQSAA